MADRPLSPAETLDSSASAPPPLVDRSEGVHQSSSPSADSSNPSELSRSSSFSRLNAKAPEFVPRAPSRADLPQQQQQPPPRLVPAPMPSGLVPVFRHHPNPTFHVPIQAPVAVAVQNHHHLHHHHQPQYHPQHRPQFYGGGACADAEADVPAQELPAEPDSAPSPKNGLSDEAIQKIVNQVEYYFSDMNLATTDHLIRFINKDPEGYVPISVVAAFKKIKAYTSSHSQLAGVLRNSKKLVVSEDGKKVKRQHPFTESDMKELQARIIIAENLPEDHCYQKLMKLFSTVGSVKSIRTCQPQASNSGGSSASRSGKAENFLFSNKLHAFVEYGTVELAEKAVTELNGEGSWRSGLRVRLLLKHASKPNQARVKKGNEVDANGEEDHEASISEQPNEKSPEESSQQFDAHFRDHAGEEHVNDRDNGQRKVRNRGRGKGRGRPQSHQHNNNRGGPVGTPPANGLSPNEPAVAKQPPGPRMPDGTRGFTMGRGKPITVNVT